MNEKMGERVVRIRQEQKIQEVRAGLNIFTSGVI